MGFLLVLVNITAFTIIKSIQKHHETFRICRRDGGRPTSTI